jgi:EAL domain-containing protein (putative c-di-GMP-specific phosphodiesterase class I)
MEAGVGVNSPEFLQKKIERLKTALDEANVLMDRQVTERDEARAQLDGVRRENEELRQQLEQLRAKPPVAPAPEPEQQTAALDPELEQPTAALDPELEQSLRRRIAELQAERDALQAATSSSDAESELRGRIASMQSELDGAQRDLASARADAETARREADTVRRESQSQVAATSARRPTAGSELPAPGPFVSQEVIRDALDNDNFVLFCQPVFSLHAERITQYELLLRLRDGDGRMVRPFSFLEPADRFGLMGEIDRWVVQRALDLLERDNNGDLRLEVNIAAQSLADFELTALIEQQIAMSDLDPGRLILEVSENVAAAHLEECQRLAKRLRGLGCRFALDDFGSTFASFRHLRDIPINYLKIDGDLIVTVTESRTGQLTVKSLVELARGLGAETIAEYVSDDQTLEFLRDQGVGYAQGYRIGRPRPIEEVLGAHTTHQHEPPPPKRVERPALESGGEEEGGQGEPEFQPEQQSDYQPEQHHEHQAQQHHDYQAEQQHEQQAEQQHEQQADQHHEQQADQHHEQQAEQHHDSQPEHSDGEYY